MTAVEDVSGERRRPGVGGWDVALSILVAFNFAVAQPILDLIGRFPQFFLARRSPRIDLVLLAIGLAIVIPGLIALFVTLVRSGSRRLGAGLHVVVLGGLTASLAMQVLERLPGLRTAAAPVLATGAVVVALAILVLWYRSAGVRRAVSLAAISAILLPALFLFSSNASKLVIRRSAAISGSAVIGNPVPVVMLFLDELPVASLMTPEGNIDAAAFPNFARLASASTWFRNTTGVHDFTEIAVPAMLTGSYGDKRKLPIATDYPDSVFSLLGGAYEVHASEAFTQLCPIAICTASSKPAPAFVPRWRSMLSDLRIIYEHVVAPPSFDDRLPSIDQTWANFGGAAGKPASAADAAAVANKDVLVEDPLGDFRAFTRSITAPARPSFWFAHVELPHAPWRYLPSGQEYPQRPPIPGRVGQVWGDDEWLLAQAYQRHLLQTVAVDRELGDFIGKLQASGLWDRALVIVTADHGVSFRPGSDLRVIRKETAGEVAAVPLFVKLPGQKTGAVDDRPVETFDVVPTIADVLEIGSMYRTDGVSVFDEGPARTERVMRSMRGHQVPLGIGLTAAVAQARAKAALFGTAGGVERFYGIAPGPYASLLGTAVPSSAPGSAGRVAIDASSAYQRIDPEASTLRTLVMGTLRGVPGTQPVVAVAIRGRVVAVSRAFVRGGQIRFHAMVPPEAFREGANRIEVYLVDDRSGAPTLRRIAPEV